MSTLSVDPNRMSESIGHRRMTVSARFHRIAFLIFCVMSLALPLLAQSPNGSMNGRVLDPSNRVISGADVLVINDATGVKYASKTNDDGIYVVPNLPPGSYRLQVSKVGFKTLIKPDIILNIQDALSINFTLPIGAVFDAVTVEGGASMINTTDASVSTVIDQTYVKNMPLNGRSFQDLILLTPGVVTQSPQNTGNTGVGQTGEFSVNGQRQEANNYTVDGVSANVGAGPGNVMTTYSGASGSLPASSALGTTQALVSVDDLQEFRVQSSTYSAEYGRNPGGQFVFETKSGTNQWHGTAYDYLRNGAFDANDWFNDYFGLTEPALRQNDFGGTLGGAVDVPGAYHGKDKSFFFVSYEGLRLAAPHEATAYYVPDPCMRGVAADCPAGRIPAASALQPALNAFPVPSPNGLEDAVNGFGQSIESWSSPASLGSTSIRFDHVVNDTLRFFFRFSDTNSSSTVRGIQGVAPSSEVTSAYTIRTYTGGASIVFSNRLSNDFRLNYSSNEVAQTQVINAFAGSAPVNLAQLAGLGVGSLGQFFLIYDGYVVGILQQLQAGAQRQWNLVDAVSLSLGRHRFKFGADYRRLAPIATPPSPQVNYYYFSQNSLSANTSTVLLSAYVPAYASYTNFSAFAQDEWRVARRLSLSLGLRWELNPAPGVTQGLKPYTVQGSSPNTWTLAPEGTPLWQTTRFNFAPRLGIAYILRETPGWETVVRSGGGVFYDTGQQLGSLGFLGPGFTAQVVGGAAFPMLPAGGIPAVVNPPPTNFGDAYAFAPHLQLPYTLQWNVSIEQALGKWQSLTMSYLGAHASRLLQENQIIPSNPNANYFFFVQNGLTSDYESLQVQFRRRLSKGLMALASYTGSHCIDYGSLNYFIGYQRGNCDFDVRSNFSAAFSYDLPSAGKNRFANTLLDHWGVDSRLTARTAFPVTLDGSATLNPAGQLYYGGLDRVSGQSVYLYGNDCATILQGLGDLTPGRGCPGGRVVNPLAFVVPSSGLGDAPRNFVRGFGAWQMDLAVRRDFPMHERLKLQFRAEAFNIFNHPNFGTINANFGQATFGQATATLANSLGVLSPLYQLGGPRSMQFALKLIF